LSESGQALLIARRQMKLRRVRIAHNMAPGQKRPDDLEIVLVIFDDQNPKC
jgi:hypothetical protein